MSGDLKLSDRQLALLVLYGGPLYTERGGSSAAGASPYQIETLIRKRAGGVLGSGKSWCYEQTKKLAADGYLEAFKLEGKLRPITVYALTRSGCDAIERWLRTPPKLPRIDSEALIRTRAGRFLQPDLILKGLEGLRPLLTSQLGAIEVAQYELSNEFSSDAYELDLLRSVVQAHLRWLGRTERALRREIRKRKLESWRPSRS